MNSVSPATGRKSNQTWRPMARPAGAPSAREAKENAEKLIAVAGQSVEMEAWISRQLKAGQKPSQILAELNLTQPLFDRVCNALASGSVRLAAATSLTFALTVISLAVGVH